ncbi:LysE family translocator [Rhodospirillaceae bacterium KN72]|uniref:LysE family translocator n=1 Tax=Pacificispira spongiicola TaxID=2729598 RepID=A0A7Y0E3J5_9PROT|nr:LysE family translocator [Pacificispira spongiicola]NMM45811.1 LysE family translocator [Pacificispira spongiicola]
MPGWETLLPFFAATLVFAILPGPALLYTAAQTLAHGRRGGFMAALGIHLGGFAHVGGAALGLAALFSLVPLLYSVLKIGGALYLIYIGFGILRSRFDPSVPQPEMRRRSESRAFLQSMVVEILNPKTALFFVAFLPQFASPEAALPIWGQMLILGLIVNLAFSLADVVAVLLTGAVLSAVSKGQRTIRLIRWAGGSILIGLGAHLAFSER